MKFENYIFSGFGMSHGKYKITNSDINDAIDKEFLQGFSKEKIAKSEKYLEYKKINPEASPFDYFAGHIMGFYERHHVTPFPPTTKKLYYADTSLELCVGAVENAINDAGIDASEVDAWYVSTVSPHEQAPGIAATIKSFFVPFGNETPAFTLASGCAGFNINLEAAVGFFKSNPEAKHIVIAHTETMSSFLTQRTKFVPFVTFGDAAAAVVLSRVNDSVKYGLINLVNLHDQKMLNYVGVDHKRNLYMDDSLIKDRATINLPAAANKCLKNSEWSASEVDWLVPHQTGNVILFPSAKEIGIDANKVFLGGQNFYGNVSGATVPLSLCMMKNQGLLQENRRILSATAGVGGNFGAFSYVCGPEKTKLKTPTATFAGKKVLILGASGNVGLNVAEKLSNAGAELYLQGNNNISKLSKIKNAKVFSCDFTDDKSVAEFVLQLKNSGQIFDYVIKLSGSANPDDCMKVNFLSPAAIINSILPQIKSNILVLASASEDIEFPDAEAWIASNRAFHGYLASASGEFLKNGIRTVYLLSGFLENGISAQFNEKYIFKFMLLVGQESRLKTNNISNNIIKSLYLPKVLRVAYSYENAMLCGRVGYQLEVDV